MTLSPFTCILLAWIERSKYKLLNNAYDIKTSTYVSPQRKTSKFSPVATEAVRVARHQA